MLFSNELEAIRKRPAVYIAGGNSSAGFYNLLFVVLDNLYTNTVKHIHLDFSSETACTITFNGAVIPEKTDGDKIDNTPLVEKVMTSWLSSSSWKPLLIVNALSKTMSVSALEKGELWYVESSHGHIIKRWGKIDSLYQEEDHRVMVYFDVDNEIFEGKPKFRSETLLPILKEFAAIVDVPVSVTGLGSQTTHISYNHDLSNYLLDISQSEPIAPPLSFEFTRGDMNFRAALLWIQGIGSGPCFRGFVNTGHMYGSHLDGFTLGIQLGVGAVFDEEEGKTPTAYRLPLVGDGIYGLICVDLPSPKLTSSGRHLEDEDVFNVVSSVVRTEVYKYVKANPPLSHYLRVQDETWQVRYSRGIF
jgi:DNA gyrase/topoisomerase IV subunit B